MHMSGSFKLLILAKRTLISKTQIVSNKLQVDSIIFSWFIRIESTCSYHEPPRSGNLTVSALEANREVECISGMVPKFVAR